MRTIMTTWQVITHNVLGNAQDGFEVNDSRSHGEVSIRLRMGYGNVGTPHEFRHAAPTDYQIGRIFGTRAKLDIDGDDITIYVNRARDGYPIGELRCTSHTSLSPIK